MNFLLMKSFLQPNSGIESTLSNASILIKGNRAAELEKLAARLKLHQHQTYLQIDLGAIRKNIAFYKSKLQSLNKVIVHGEGIILWIERHKDWSFLGTSWE